MGSLTDQRQERKPDGIRPAVPSDSAPRTAVMQRAQTLERTTVLYSAFYADIELKSLAFYLAGVKRPSFEEFLTSIRGVFLDLRAANRVTLSDPATSTTASAVTIEPLVAPVVEFDSRALIYIYNSK